LIPKRAEIHSCSKYFSILVSQSLQTGNALLLIDGLDEISEDKNRLAFVNQLRIFIATFPDIQIIVTSREAGFRIVAGSLASYCNNFVVASLTQKEIEELCLKWHTAIIDNSNNTKKEARKLSSLILRDNRITALAENPLLLTTLLFVKRWAGYLPTKKSVLYQEMIKLLLVTWNVEGHEILDIDEAEPQLSYVAYWMTKNGQQTITFEELKNCLINARKELPEILGYTKVSPPDFIKRVESRSSLLILSGHKMLDSGIITQVYEFLHLSFQEYLTAKAIVKGYIPNSDSYKKAIEIIKPNINDENWKEIIPLAAVLLERDTKDLIEFLISESRKASVEGGKRKKRIGRFANFLLGSCLANEIQISPDLLEIAIETFLKSGKSTIDTISTEIILKNKFGELFRSKVKKYFFEDFEDEYSFHLGSLIKDIYSIDQENNENKFHIIDQISIDLENDSKEIKCAAILGLMGYAFSYRNSANATKPDFEKICPILITLLNGRDPRLWFSICWSIAWSVEANFIPDEVKAAFTIPVVKIWINAKGSNMQRAASWAGSMILTPRFPKRDLLKIPKIRKTITARLTNPDNEFDNLLSLYLAFQIGLKIEPQIISSIFQIHKSRFFRFNDSNSSLSLFASAHGINLKNLKTNPNFNR
jgi:hypothetical protein